MVSPVGMALGRMQLETNMEDMCNSIHPNKQVTAVVVRVSGQPDSAKGSPDSRSTLFLGATVVFPE